MTEKQQIEIFIVIDADNDYAVGVNQEMAEAAFEETIGGSGPRRIIELKARLTPPAIESGPTIDIPDAAGTTQQIEVEAA